MPTEVPVLEYSSPADGTPARKRHWSWLVLWLPAAVVPFVPFSCRTSPVEVIYRAAQEPSLKDPEEWMLVLLASGLILGSAPFLWQARLLRAKTTSAVERAFAHAFGASMLLITAAISAIGCVWDRKAQLYSRVAFPSLLVVGSIPTFIRLRRHWSRDDAASAILAAGYASVASMATLLFWGDTSLQLGWYLTFAGALLALAESGYLIIAARRTAPR